MNVWITKFALTRGIISCEAEETNYPRMIRAGGRYYHSADWHRSFTAATERAHEMRRNRIAALEKQISRLILLNFQEVGL